MFEGSDFPKSLDEDQFDLWLKKGRDSKIRYEYMAVLWDEFEEQYTPAYLETRSQISEYEIYGASANQESLIGVYDLYSEARLNIHT